MILDASGRSGMALAAHVSGSQDTSKDGNTYMINFDKAVIQLRQEFVRSQERCPFWVGQESGQDGTAELNVTLVRLKLIKRCELASG